MQRILLALAILSAPSAAQIPGPSFEDVIGLEGVGSVAISPSGRHVAYTVTSVDWEGNRFDSEIWLSKDGGSPFQLTRTPDGSSSSPQWSPDGRWIAFTSDRGDENQIHVISADGGEARPVTGHEGGVGSFEWSPDGSRIAYTATEPEPDRQKKLKETFGDFEIDDEGYRMSHLWVVDVPSDSMKGVRLTEGSGLTVQSFSWSPDGGTIAVEHAATPLVDGWMTADLSLLDADTKELTPLVRNPGYDGGVQWSPDGSSIAYFSADGNVTSNYYTSNRLYVMRRDGASRREVGADFDEDRSVVAWTPKGILFTAWQRTERGLFLLDPESGSSIRLSTPRNVFSVSVTPDGETVAFTAGTESTLTEVYSTRIEPFEPEKLTDMTAQIAEWPGSTSEVVSWTSRDGAEIEGVLFKPADFDPGRAYPLLVVIHGGPTGIDFPAPVDSYVYPIMQWLAKGAVVLEPNYRGSAGYGAAFRALNVRNLGVGDAWDVLSGVDYLVEAGIADPDSMGAMGWSQGGYISAFLATNTDRFKAISVGAGISNWMTYYVNTDIHPFTRQYLEATPWEDPEIYAVTSPMTTITRASTPTQIQHGEFDRRVPIPNAYELLQGLRDMGVPSRLVVYKGFGHGITKPKERLAAMWHNWQWFGKYVWGEEVELPVEE